MLIYMLPLLLYFTASKRYPGASSSSKIKKTLSKKPGRDYLVYDEASGRTVQRSVLYQERAAEARRLKQEAALQREESAKRAEFENISSVKSLNKEDFRTMRMQNFYAMPNNSSDGHFWRKEQELIMKEIYAHLDPKALVCPQKPLHFPTMAKKQYFVEALWVARKLGLERLMSTIQDYDIIKVQQFFATLVLGPEEDTKMTWMTGPVQCSATFSEFGRLLGYGFKGVSTPVGRRMHVEGQSYDKKLLLPLCARNGTLATTRGLKPIYNILIRMFRWSIAPQAGNTDAIRGALVNLMHHAHRAYLAGPECQGFEIDVMDFMRNEMHITLIERKNPMYAPYVMKLILSKLQLDPSRFTAHKFGTLQVLSIHSSSQRTYEEIEEEEAPRARRKNATPSSSFSGGRTRVNNEVKRVSWWQKTMLCMGIAVHKENHQNYVSNKRILSNQAKMLKELRKTNYGGRTPPRPQGAPPSPPSERTIPLEEWNCDTFPWGDFQDVSSLPTSSRNTGKAPMTYEEASEEDSEEEHEEASDDDDDDDDGDNDADEDDYE